MPGDEYWAGPVALQPDYDAMTRMLRARRRGVCGDGHIARVLTAPANLSYCDIL